MKWHLSLSLSLSFTYINTHKLHSLWKVDMKSHSQSGDGTKDLDQELKLLLGVLPLRLDLLLSEDSET